MFSLCSSSLQVWFELNQHQNDWVNVVYIIHQIIFLFGVSLANSVLKLTFSHFFIFNHKLSSCIDWRRTRSQRKKNIISYGLVLACESIEIRYGLKWISNYEYNIIVTNMENCIFHNSIRASYVCASQRGLPLKQGYLASKLFRPHISPPNLFHSKYIFVSRDSLKKIVSSLVDS